MNAGNQLVLPTVRAVRAACSQRVKEPWALPGLAGQGITSQNLSLNPKQGEGQAGGTAGGCVKARLAHQPTGEGNQAQPGLVKATRVSPSPRVVTPMLEVLFMPIMLGQSKMCSAACMKI